jgi:hypothetical protein
LVIISTIAYICRLEGVRIGIETRHVFDRSILSSPLNLEAVRNALRITNASGIADLVVDESWCMLKWQHPFTWGTLEAQIPTPWLDDPNMEEHVVEMAREFANAIEVAHAEAGVNL